jgi:hypothetical protein
LIVVQSLVPCCPPPLHYSTGPGTSQANPINLGSQTKILRTDLTTGGFPDTALSGCADPDNFNNQTKGDGGDAVSRRQQRAALAHHFLHRPPVVCC